MSRITFISRMTVKAGKEADFVRLCKQLTDKVRANEPGTVYYDFFNLREPRRYAVIESFADEAAEHVHNNSPYFNELAPGIVACLDGPYVREYLDPFQAP
jgi:quinol monooxygenase YgiN